MLGVAYVLTFAFVFVFSAMGPVGLLFLPVFMPGCVCAITYAHSYASTEEFCPACGKLIERKPARLVAHPVGVVARA